MRGWEGRVEAHKPRPFPICPPLLALPSLPCFLFPLLRVSTSSSSVAELPALVNQLRVGGASAIAACWTMRALALDGPSNLLAVVSHGAVEAAVQLLLETRPREGVPPLRRARRPRACS